MTVVPLIPLDDRIKVARDQERRGCLSVIEQVNVAAITSGQSFTAHHALCMAHAIINKLYGEAA